jgi:hypothetical protein
MITSGEIKLIGREVFGVAFGQAILFFAAEPKSEGVCYFLRNHILDGEEVRKFFVKCLCPER